MEGAESIPVPPDEPSAGGIPTSSLPWSAIPKFIPGTTNVQEYAQKLRFLAAMWPEEHLELLAPRAALHIEGTAFRKVSKLDPSKLKVRDVSGIALLVNTIGGSWGSTELEERYEFFEKALYGTVQKADESHDSYLSRMENNFMELISRNTKLEEVQAYVLLRQSTLPGDDKKKILLEHSGELKYEPVVKSFRLLGSKFFHDFHANKPTSKTRVYDVNLGEQADPEVPPSASGSVMSEGIFAASHEEELDIDNEFIEIMVAQSDQDAMTIQSFENEFEEFLQETPELFEAFTTYMDARARLLEKRTTRGFWPVSSSKGKGKSSFKGFKGKSKSKGRDSLLQRIARSHCRKCGALGHWKAECPQRGPQDGPAGKEMSSTASANVTEHVSPVVTFYADHQGDDVVSDQDEPEAPPNVSCSCFEQTVFTCSAEDCCFFQCDKNIAPLKSSHTMNPSQNDKTHRWSQHAHRLQSRMQQFVRSSSSQTCHIPNPTCSTDNPRSPDGQVQDEVRKFSFGRNVSSEAFVVADQLASRAILDTGASRCIIGDKTLDRLCQSLPEWLQKSLKTKPSQVRFRFGNNQTLTSIHQVLFPLKCPQGQKTLSLAVPGHTPFLFSKRAFKILGGILDTRDDSCKLSAIQTQAKLSLSPTGLYLLNIADICRRNDKGVSEAAFASQSCSEGVISEHAREPKAISELVSQSITDSNTRAKCVSSNPIESPKTRAFPIRRVCQQNAKHGRSHQDHSQCLGAGVDTTSPVGGALTGGICHRDGGDGPNRDVKSSQPNDARTPDPSSSSGRPGSSSTWTQQCPSNDPWSDCNSAVRDGIKSEPWKKSKQSTIDSRWTTFGTGMGLRGRAFHAGSNRRCSRSRGSKSPACGQSSFGSINYSSYCCSSPSRKFIEGKGIIPSHSDNSTSRSDCPRMGTACGSLGKEAQGEAILRCAEGRSGILRVEPCSLQQSTSRSTRLCEILPSSSEPLQSDRAIDFHQEVMTVREQLQQSAHSFHPFRSLKKTLKGIDRIKDKIEDLTTKSHSWNVRNHNQHRRPIKLLEIYAESHSPLTTAVTNCGHSSMRFTKADGDLSTFAGRHKLWSWIEQYEPEHIWVAPECGPWGGWNRLNQQKSMMLFDQIQLQQQREMIHVKFCAQLCDHQVRNGRHFHLEQPVGSCMHQLQVFKPIRQHTLRSIFDMCQFGLKIPHTERFLRKRSQVFTTSQQVFAMLNDRICKNQHQHQRIEGSHRFPGLGVQRVSRFCASYCHGFANKIAHGICSHVHMTVSPEQLAYHNGDDSEPPSKRLRFSSGVHKRQKVDKGPSDRTLSDTTPSVPEAPVISEDPNLSERSAPEINLPSEPPRSETDPWSAVLMEANNLAPRVGNTKCEAGSQIAQMAQRLIPDLLIHALFVCRGTERLQVPLLAPSSKDYPIRRTICTHRQTGEIHDLGNEDWHSLTRAQRIRKGIPSKITLTIFGSHQTTGLEPRSLEGVPENSSAGTENLPSAGSDLPPRSSASRVSRVDQLPKVCQPNRPSDLPLEGWAPPPVPLHGPKYRNLNAQEKRHMVQLHKNLGHPDPLVFANHLKEQGALEHIVEAARDFVCDACVESTHTKHQRPSKLHEPKDFNDMVGIDGFYWTGRAGFQVLVFHCIDEASLFHLGKRIENRHLDHVIPTWTEFWFTWAGAPNQVYSDPAGEFRADQWLNFLQSHDVIPRVSTESWQNGRAEKHGHIIKQMLDRYDNEEISSPQDFDGVLQACFQAKNALARHQGYSPEQIVLGKSKKLPASLCSDESSVAHSLAIGEGLESESFRRCLNIRARARQAFILADNSQSMRRAMLRRSCPMRGPFQPGQIVMYWMKRNKPNRQEVGRWHGPAKIVCQEGQSVVWVSHSDRLIRCAPENLRPASLREWNNQPTEILPKTLPHDDGSRQQLARELGLEDDSGVPNRRSETEPMISAQTSGQPENEPGYTPSTPLEGGTPSVVATDPPADPEALEPAELPPEAEDFAELALFSATALVLEPDHEIHEWHSYSAGLDSQVCLAEDGFPYLDDPLTCNDHQCFALEIDLSHNDLKSWAQSDKPEELVQVAQVSKRNRLEVQIKDLSNHEKALFDQAKDAELNCWMQTNALKAVLRQSLNPDQILRSRWVLTWKSLEDEQGKPDGRKAKARLVVLGFQDPQLTEVARDAPTLTREGRHTVLQTVASFAWILSSFDIKTAFLRGKADDKNPLAMEPPVELRRKMQLADNEVCALIGNAYGRVDAPLLFYKELTAQLKKLGFRSHPLEPCVHYLESWSDDGIRHLHGVLGTHVDDGVCGGDQYFHECLQKLKLILPFGAFKQRSFVFTGIHLEQLPDFSIVASQRDYIRNIPAINVGKHRRETPDVSATEEEITKLRAIIGSLQYAVTHTRPDIASRLGEVQVQLSKPTVQTLLSANKVLREAQVHDSVKICFRSISPDKVTHVAFGDASFASPKQLASFQGSLIFATTPDLQKNQQAPLSPLTWSSKKISRVVRSTLSAEAYSMSRSVDKLGWLRLLWGILAVPEFKWKEPQIGYFQLPSATVVTDCKSLYDLVTRTAIPSCEEYRTTLEVLLIRERSHEHTVFRWIPTSLQLADCLTKVMDSSLLRIVLDTSTFQLYDENYSLERNAHRKQAAGWLREKGWSLQDESTK